MASEAIDDLFAKTLIGDYDDDAPWDAIHALRRMGTREVFERAAAWCKSDPLKRARCASVLAQLGKTAEHPRNIFPEESFAAVANMLTTEENPEALASAIHALGHLDDQRGIPITLSQRQHPSADVRFAVACSLGSFPNDPQAIAALLILARDEDDDVRDWAVFALGVLGDADSVEIRDTLFSCIGDSNEDVREEAMVGLARRKDQRVLPPLITALEAAHLNDSGTGMRMLEAADALLDLESERADWSLGRYATALRERFPL